ncbi:MAG: Ribosomal RNA small subunit methyltransferase I [Firmicutes bacterium]|nr:Ribosomal RNA small subunit methyltransferase I [candidate division NPL-UPA2 bacterium]
MSGKLYVCATPIGNLADVSSRLLYTLKEVDFVAAEDTRHSAKLLHHFSINTPLISYHKHSGKAKHAQVLAALSAGKHIALISDAGMPGISDPGEELIRDAVAEGIAVTVIPGPMAGVAALAISGLPTARFAFEGFLPRGRGERRNVLAKLQHEERTLIFYEAPHRLAETLADLLEMLGERQAAVVRELTKVYENVKRGSLSALLASVQHEPVRGEIVLVVAGVEPRELTSDLDGEEVVARLLAKGLSPAQIARHAAQVCSLPRAELYALAVAKGQKAHKK